MALSRVLSPNISQNYCSSTQDYSYSDLTVLDSLPRNGPGESPLSSPLSIDESVFDHSFGQSPQTPAYTFSVGKNTDLLGRSQSAYQITYSNTQSAIPPHLAYTYVNPSAIDATTPCYTGTSFEDEAEHEYPEAEYAEVSSTTTSSERRPAWGTSSASRKSSKPSTSTSSLSKHSHKRTKLSKASSKSSKSNSKDTRLRTTPSKTHGSSSDESSNDNATRSNHNTVEKNYRNRLNAQFETLLECIPQDYNGSEANSGNTGGVGKERKVSKRDVLMLAQEHIRRLERGRERLEGDVLRLKGALATRNTIGGAL